MHLLRHAPFLFAAALPAQTITLAEGAPAALTITALAENAPAGPGVLVRDQVELLPIELTGRTLALADDGTRARRVVRHGLARIELPDGGRLFRYRRAGGQQWGFLHVAADGAPRVVLELPGAGVSGTGDPFADRVGVASDGRHAVIARAATGLHVVRLDGGTFASTGRADRAIAGAPHVLPLSVMVGPSAVWYQSATQVWRCDLADGAVGVDVSPPAVANGELKDQMALSRDGAVVVFLYGPDDHQRLWRVGTTGGASVLPPPPSKYEEPGYLPEEPGEPAMLLNDDGSRLFYVDSEPRDELWLLDLTGALPPLQITSDACFEPYIGAHILPKFAADTLVVAIGDPARMDWFRADLAPAGGTVVNLSGTAGTVQPFPSGTLAPVAAVDAGAALLVADQQAGALRLQRLDLQSGAFATLQNDLLAPPTRGSAFAGAADVLVRASSGERLHAGATGALFAALPPGILLTPPAHGPTFAATFVHLAGGLGAICLYLPDGSLVVGSIESGVRQLVPTLAGGLVIVGDPAAPVRYLAPGAAVVVNRPAAALRVCLSGAGA